MPKRSSLKINLKIKEGTAMKEILPMLQQQLKLEDTAVKRLQELRRILVDSTSGQGVAEAASTVTPLLQELGELVKKQEEWLSFTGQDTAAAYVETQADSPEKQLAQRLLAAIGVMQERLRNALAADQQLLKKSGAFIQFHINVMNQAQASDIYAPPGAAAPAGDPRGRQMFDAGV